TYKSPAGHTKPRRTDSDITSSYEAIGARKWRLRIKHGVGRGCFIGWSVRRRAGVPGSSTRPGPTEPVRATTDPRKRRVGYHSRRRASGKQTRSDSREIEDDEVRSCTDANPGWRTRIGETTSA